MQPGHGPIWCVIHSFTDRLPTMVQQGVRRVSHDASLDGTSGALRDGTAAFARLHTGEADEASSPFRPVRTDGRNCAARVCDSGIRAQIRNELPDVPHHLSEADAVRRSLPPERIPLPW